MAMNFVDVDGHILEPSDLWTTRVDARYRDRALQLLKDDDGLEFWSVDGEAIPYFAGGTSADAATIGKSEQWRLENIYEKRSLTWQDGLDMNPGACDPVERIKLMDREGIDLSILYATLGLMLPGIPDPELSAAHCRAYNDWIVEFCRTCPERLVPAVFLPWGDVDETLKELKRTSGIGRRAIEAPAGPPGDLSFADAHWDPVWAELQDQGVPVALHVGYAGTPIGTILHPELMARPSWWDFIVGPLDTVTAFVSFFQGAVFDRYPELKLVVLEADCAWMPWLLHRMDEIRDVIGFTAPMQLRPSEYFQRQCWVSMEPDDELALDAIAHLGADKLVWAYDFPHSDSGTDPVVNLKETLKDLSAEDQHRIMARNAIELYQLDAGD